MKLLIFLVVVSAFFVSCSRDNEEDLFRLSLDRTTLRLDTVAGSAGSVVLQARVPWTAEVSANAAAWLQIDKTSGGLGKINIRVSFVRGSSVAVGQSGTITFRPAGGHGRAVTLTVTLQPYTFSLLTSKTLPSSGIGSSQPARTPDGGLMFGLTTSNHGGHGANDVWLIKLNAVGDTVWTRMLGGSQDDKAGTVAFTADGNFILIGSTQSSDGDITDKRITYGEDMWVVKLDGNGRILWSKTFGGSAGDIGTGVVGTPDGGYLVSGDTESNNGEITGSHGSSDAWVLKLDGQGRPQWSKVYGGSDFDQIGAIRAIPGGYVLTGLTNSADGDVKGYHPPSYIGSDVLVIRIDPAGNLVWAKAYGGTEDEVATAMVAVPDGMVVTAYTDSNNGDVSGYHGGQIFTTDLWVLKLNYDGDIVWTRTIGGSSEDVATTIANTPDGGLVLAGSTFSNDGDIRGNHNTRPNGGDFWILKLDGSGNTQWSKLYGGSGDDVIYSILVDPDGYTMLGLTSSTDGDIRSHSSNEYDLWIGKLIVQ